MKRTTVLGLFLLVLCLTGCEYLDQNNSDAYTLTVKDLNSDYSTSIIYEDTIEEGSRYYTIKFETGHHLVWLKKRADQTILIRVYLYNEFRARLIQTGDELEEIYADNVQVTLDK